MSFTLDQVVLWGRSLEEYAAMFSLSPDDMEKSILGCADGPASFNAEMSAAGHRVCSVDPVYSFGVDDLRPRIEEAFPLVMEQLGQNPDDYLWTRFASPEDLAGHRRQAMDMFLSDFLMGKEEGRYIPCGLEELPFGDRDYDLALCSHFLFLYSGRLSLSFHLRAVDEMLRAAREVRIFPLLDMGGQPSPHLEQVCSHVNGLGWQFVIETVDYEFQRGGNQMLRIW